MVSIRERDGDHRSDREGVKVRRCRFFFFFFLFFLVRAARGEREREGE